MLLVYKVSIVILIIGFIYLIRKKESYLTQERFRTQELIADHKQQQVIWGERLKEQTLKIQQLEDYSNQCTINDALLKEKYDKELHFRKSSEVRLGKIGENMAPLFNEWPYDPNYFRFLGNPIDGVQFTEDEIIFVEIKTGKSSLSKQQRHIRDLVKEGKVKFGTFRIDDKGSTFKIL